MSTLATLRYDFLNLPSQGTLGNLSVRCADPSNQDAFSGNMFVQQLLSVAGTQNATDFATGAISTTGGIDAQKDLYIGGKGTLLQSLSVGTSGTFGTDVTLGGRVQAATGKFTDTSASAISVSNGGVTASSLTSNSLLTSIGTTLLQGTTQVSGPFAIQTLTDSTNATSGSFITSGGIGIGKALFAAGSLNTAANVNATGKVTAASGQYTSTSDATSTSTGSLTTLGGFSSGKSAYIGTDFFTGATTGSGQVTYRFSAKSSSNEINISPDGSNSAIYANTTEVLFGSTLSNVIFQNTTNAADFNTGGVQILGGASIQKDLYLKGSLFLNGPVSGTNTINFTNLTASTLPTNGAVVIAGGLGVSHETVGSTLIAGLSTVISATSTRSGNLQSRGGLGVDGDIYGGSTLNISGLSNFAGGFVANAAASVNSTLTVSGKSFLQNDVAVSSTTVPTSVSTPAALSVTGGSAVAGASYFGSTVNVGNTVTLAYNSGNTSQLYLNGPASNSGTLGMTSNSLTLYAPTAVPVKINSDTGLTYIDGSTPTDVNARTRFSATSTRVYVGNTVDATILGTAGFVTDSGASIALSAIIGQNLNVKGTLDATSLTSASVLIAGGSAITKQLRVGGNSTLSADLSVGGNSTLLGNLSVTALTSLTGALTSTSSGSFAGSLIAGGTLAAQSSANCSWDPTSSVQATGSLVSYGGGVVQKDFIVGNNQTVYGSSLLKGATTIGGNVTINSTTTSTSAATQALVVAGGASFGAGTVTTGASIFYGDMFLYGNLKQNGTTDRINVDNYYVKDNIVSINVGNPYPDSGLCFHRYQFANDTSSGFVISDAPYYNFTVASSSGDNITVKLPSSASTTDNAYSGWLKIVSGTGQNQVRHIKSYAGSTQTLTISSTADQTAYDTANPPASGTSNLKIGLDFTAAPDSTSVIALYNGSTGAFLQQQLSSGPVFKLGYLANDPLGSTNNNVLSRLATLSLAVLDATTSVNSDSYLPHTSGGNISLNNSITVSPAGALSGVTSINGNPGQLKFVLTVSESAFRLTGGTNIPITQTYGTLSYVVIPTDDTGSRTYGAITCNRTSSTLGYGSPSTSVVQLPGVNGEQVAIYWTYGSVPVLSLSTSRPAANQTGSAITYTLYCTLY